MMVVQPERIAFTEQDDIIDYVTKGLPPTKKNFEKVISKVKNPDNSGDFYYRNAPKAGVEVVINDYVVPYDQRDQLDHTLKRVYKNRIRNRNTALIVGGLVVIGAIGILLGGGGGSSKKNVSDDPKPNNDDINNADDLYNLLNNATANITPVPLADRVRPDIIGSNK